jgi:hypothetical protein
VAKLSASLASVKVKDDKEAIVSQVFLIRAPNTKHRPNIACNLIPIDRSE